MKISEQFKKLEILPNLSVVQQTIVKVLAVYHGYSSLINLGNCLSRLGVKDGIKEFNPKLLKGQCKPLLASGLLEESGHSGGVRCTLAIADLIVRKMVSEDQFERHATAIERQNPVMKGFRGYITMEQGLREARIAFYRDDHFQLHESLSSGARFVPNFPSKGDVLLSWFCNPLDLEWTIRHQPKLLGKLLEYGALHQLLYLYAEPHLENVYGRIIPADEGTESGFLFRGIMELRFLRGDWQAVKILLENRQDPELLAIAAAITFLTGEHAVRPSSFSIKPCRGSKNRPASEVHIFMVWPGCCIRLPFGRAMTTNCEGNCRLFLPRRSRIAHIGQMATG